MMPEYTFSNFWSKKRPEARDRRRRLPTRVAGRKSCGAVHGNGVAVEALSIKSQLTGPLEGQ